MFLFFFSFFKSTATRPSAACNGAEATTARCNHRHHHNNNKACPTTMTNSRGHTCWRAALLFLFSPFPLFFFFSRAQLPGCCSLHRLVTRVFVEAIWTSTGCSGSFVPGGLWAVADAGLLPSYPHSCGNISTSHRTPRGTSHLQNGWRSTWHGTAGESLEPLMLSEMFLILLMWFSREAAYARTPRTPPHDHHSSPLVQFCSCAAVVPFFFSSLRGRRR